MENRDEIDWIQIGEGTWAANIPTGVLVRYGEHPCFVPSVKVVEPTEASEMPQRKAERYGKLVAVPSAAES